MDISRKKQILNNYRHLEQELQEKLNDYKEARSKLSGVGAQIIDDMPKCSIVTFDKIGEGLGKLEHLENMHREKLNECIRVRNAISELKDPLLRKILILRYVELMTYPRISKEISYSRMHVYRLHHMAVEKIIL